MPLRLRADGTYHAWTLMEDNGQEVSFSGYGNTREEAYANRDSAVATGIKAYPGIKPLETKVSPLARETWDYVEPRKAPAMCTTVIEWPDGKVSRRDDMDWNDRDRRRAFLSAVGRAMVIGGRVQMISDAAVA